MPLGLLEPGGVPPIDGGVSPEALGLYKDLMPFWSRIGGDSVYQDAVDHVNAMWAEGVLTSWADASTIVEAHDPHPGIVEGLEGVEHELVNDEEAASDAEDTAAHSGDGGVPPAAAAAAAAADDDAEADERGAGDHKQVRPAITCFQHTYENHDVAHDRHSVVHRRSSLIQAF